MGVMNRDGPLDRIKHDAINKKTVGFHGMPREVGLALLVRDIEQLTCALVHIVDME
jgi:hypothetical protein